MTTVVDSDDDVSQPAFISQYYKWRAAGNACCIQCLK